MTAPSTPPVLSVRGIHKAFGHVEALTDVDLDVHAHEVVALVGDNAAGKSTLAKIISGVLQPDAGIIELDGEPVTVPSAAVAHTLGIATVFQELALCDNLDVVQNLFLGREVRKTRTGRDGRRHGSNRAGAPLDDALMEGQAREILTALTSHIPSVRTPLAQLSAGQRQTVAIARTLLGNPRLVVLDEPTASLSVAHTAEVLTHIERLRDLGHAVVLISHNLNDVRAVADRIEVLRHGRNNGTFAARNATYELIVAAITGATSLLHA
ncbi:ATP-binding cassette domain-containing protein [Xylanimonas ulmi]|uniref:Monosaccharide ABC transporter ATP-binding protein (CUT2 family) n=1 Tax=Xylanimonas ulmi TaxID=228973 RepID=A0A4Q7M6E4_9MICO|nr:ATP-binding cassette domain-containing protein [Xylanibacterium ulmi]RZS63254.1 monosaccharide ABC transporter ATP-binding protein (CUT2 family) [Xylanibacterium ulmi]